MLSIQPGDLSTRFALSVTYFGRSLATICSVFRFGEQVLASTLCAQIRHPFHCGLLGAITRKVIGGVERGWPLVILRENALLLAGNSEGFWGLNQSNCPRSIAVFSGTRLPPTVLAAAAASRPWAGHRVVPLTFLAFC